MKRFRIMYYLNTCMKDCFVKADNEQEALEKFKELKGEKKIIRIKEVSEEAYRALMK